MYKLRNKQREKLEIEKKCTRGNKFKERNTDNRRQACS